MELRITFNDKYTMFINLDPDNICSPAVFKFINQYVENLNNSYKANPMLFDVRLSPMNVGVKPFRYEFPKNHNRSSTVQAKNNQGRLRKPCPLYIIKEFDSEHFPLSWTCGVKKLSSAEIIKIMDKAKVYPSCC